MTQCHGGFTDGEQPVTLSICGHSVETIRYCVSKEKVSIHLPVSRLLAGKTFFPKKRSLKLSFELLFVVSIYWIPTMLYFESVLVQISLSLKWLLINWKHPRLPLSLSSFLLINFLIIRLKWVTNCIDRFFLIVSSWFTHYLYMLNYLKLLPQSSQKLCMCTRLSL